MQFGCPVAMPLHQSFAITCQLTPPLLGSLMTVAINCCVPPEGAVAEGGDTDTAIRGVTVMVDEPALVMSAAEVAVRVTIAGLGTVAGAV